MSDSFNDVDVKNIITSSITTNIYLNDDQPAPQINETKLYIGTDQF